MPDPPLLWKDREAGAKFRNADVAACEMLMKACCEPAWIVTTAVRALGEAFAWQLITRLALPFPLIWSTLSQEVEELALQLPTACKLTKVAPPADVKAILDGFTVRGLVCAPLWVRRMVRELVWEPYT